MNIQDVAIAVGTLIAVGLIKPTYSFVSSIISNIKDSKKENDCITRLEHEKALNAAKSEMYKEIEKTEEKMRNDLATKEMVNSFEKKLQAIENTINQNARDSANSFMQVNTNLQNFTQSVMQALTNCNIERRTK